MKSEDFFEELKNELNKITPKSIEESAAAISHSNLPNIYKELWIDSMQFSLKQLKRIKEKRGV